MKRDNNLTVMYSMKVCIVYNARLLSISIGDGV
jgi:hypothetical protein